MAEEEKPEQVQAKSGLGKTLVAVGVIVVVAGVAGLGTFKLVLAPMFAEPANDGEPVTDKIPVTAVMVDFSGLRASVLTDDSETPALLQYSITLVCANPQTALLVEGRTQLFVAMLVKLHDARTKEDLNDPVARESVLRQAKNEANALLKRIQEQVDPMVEVIEVMYTEYTVIDL